MLQGNRNKAGQRRVSTKRRTGAMRRRSQIEWVLVLYVQSILGLTGVGLEVYSKADRQRSGYVHTLAAGGIGSIYLQRRRKGERGGLHEPKRKKEGRKERKNKNKKRQRERGDATLQA